jgi:intracellular multiplication protein IcmE
MANNQNDIDDFDFDGGAEDNFAGAPPVKNNVKQLWDGNPVLKIAAVIAGVAVLAGAYYFVFVYNKVEDKNISAVTEGSDVKAVPGETVLDPEMQKAIEDKNRTEAERAREFGTSAMPIPIGTSQDQLPTPEVRERPQDDQLAEWRTAAEARRILLQQTETTPSEEVTGPQADVVPTVQPVRPQQVQQSDPNLIKALAQQMRTVIAAQAPETFRVEMVTATESPYMAMKREQEAEKQAQFQQATAGDTATRNNPKDDHLRGTGAGAPKVIIPPGTVIYAQLLNELNSDVPGPVLAAIASGPFAGGRAIGKFRRRDEFLYIEFDQIVKGDKVYFTEAVALDPQTTLSGMQTDVDKHYFSRVILPAAAKFVEGYAGAAADTGASSTSSTTSTTTTSPEPDTREELLKGVEEGASEFSSILEENAKNPITVKVARGSPMGILVLQTIFETSNTKAPEKKEEEKQNPLSINPLLLQQQNQMLQALTQSQLSAQTPAAPSGEEE